MLIINLNESLSRLRNDLSGKQNCMEVKLEGVKSNRSANGARVLWPITAGKRQAQSVLSQSSLYSSNDRRRISASETILLVNAGVHWPSGLVESFKHLSIHPLIALREGVAWCQTGAGQRPNAKKA